MLIYFSKIQCMLNYDQKKDLNKSETLSIKCVQRLEEKNSCVIFPNLKSSTPVVFLCGLPSVVDSS